MNILNKLKKSRFRSSFHLTNNDKLVVENKGIEKMKEHAFNILSKRLMKKPINDGKQTPWKGYPIFIAQHATGTCCRGCMKKWYQINEDKVLNKEEIDYFSDLIVFWIEDEICRKV